MARVAGSRCRCSRGRSRRRAAIHLALGSGGNEWVCDYGGEIRFVRGCAASAALYDGAAQTRIHVDGRFGGACARTRGRKAVPPRTIGCPVHYSRYVRPQGAGVRELTRLDGACGFLRRIRTADPDPRSLLRPNRDIPRCRSGWSTHGAAQLSRHAAALQPRLGPHRVNGRREPRPDDGSGTAQDAGRTSINEEGD